MFSSLLRIDLSWPRAARTALKALMLASISPGWAAGAHAQVDVKKAIVKIVTSGTRVFENGSTELVKAYEGSGFIVYSKDQVGGAQTVIVTADHVLGYSQSKAHDPNNITFKTDVRDAPPVWVNRDDQLCSPELRVKGETPESSQPCRRIDVYYLDRGEWVKYNTDVHVHRQGNKNQDFAVLWLKFAHDDQRALEIGNASSLNEAAQRAGNNPLPPLMAWGIEAKRPKDDPFTTQLTYRRRDDGPTLLFQTTVKPGNSGGPIMFEGKVIGIISAVQGEETRATRINTLYDALANWDIPSVQHTPFGRAAGTSIAVAQLADAAGVDDRLVGSWVKTQAGHLIDFKPNGDVSVMMQGPFIYFSGLGSLSRCIDGGGNICIATAALGTCSFRLTFRQGAGMNVDKRKGSSVCDELSGDYTRQAP